MKKPYLNLEQRESIYLDTLNGDICMLNLRFRQLIREYYRMMVIPIYKLISK